MKIASDYITKELEMKQKQLKQALNVPYNRK